MRYFLVYILIVSFLISCNSEKNKSEIPAIQEKELEELDAEMDISVKNTDIPFVLLLNDESYLASLKSVKDTISDYSFYKLDEFTRRKGGETHFKYYIIKELELGESFKSYLIAEDYESEKACWLVNYNADTSLIDFCEVYYDNAEGFLWVDSSIDISNKTIKITEGNIYNNPEIVLVQLKINKDGKFVEKKES